MAIFSRVLKQIQGDLPRQDGVRCWRVFFGWAGGGGGSFFFFFFPEEVIFVGEHVGVCSLDMAFSDLLCFCLFGGEAMLLGENVGAFIEMAFTWVMCFYLKPPKKRLARFQVTKNQQVNSEVFRSPGALEMVFKAVSSEDLHQPER